MPAVTQAAPATSPEIEVGGGVPTLPPPPPAPRPIADSYAWSLFWTDAGGIVGFVFSLLGAIFSFVGVILTIAIVTAFVGIPFALLGFAFLGLGLVLVNNRYKQAQAVVNVLKLGEATHAEIVSVEPNYNVRVNGRNPWRITYRFTVNNRAIEGNVSTLNRTTIKAGETMWVLYAPNTPEVNSLYPHP
jgi:hypothetical protein